MKPGYCICLFLYLLFAANYTCANDLNRDEVLIGSKNFTENIILGEIATQLVRSANMEVSHKSGLGGSRILWTALVNGEISAYPEYTGTLVKEIFSAEKIDDFSQLKEMLAQQGIGISGKLGFNNTYIVGMLEEPANAAGVSNISDLKHHPEFKFAFSNEFMQRADGWPGLRQHYQLPQSDVRGLDHDLAYRALQSRAIDAMDLYSTDAEIQYYKIRSLLDDQNYFPAYHAVFLYRLDSQPGLIQELQDMAGRISRDDMIEMNAAVKLDGKKEKTVAAAFIKKVFAIDSSYSKNTAYDRFWLNTRDHLTLVAISLCAAICLAIPLGIIAARNPFTAQLVLGICGVLQTIPSLALFVFLIPLMGIGGPPTIVALFIYSLLPIIRNTYSGLHDIPASIRESAQVIGLPAATTLRQVELPLACRSILAGIKTSAVINVGTATLGAFIGAGGYGQPILAGIRLDDIALILEGAVPAAVLALLVQGLFEFIERVLLPLPLRYQGVNNGL